MRVNRAVLSAVCLLSVLLLSSINVTYAWDSMHQTALNIAAGKEIEAEPDEPEIPDKPENPDTPTEPDSPAAPQEPSKNPESSGAQQTNPSPQPSTGASQTGKSDMTTGDTAQFLLYLSLMLISFAVMSVTGAVLLTLTIHAIRK